MEASRIHLEPLTEEASRELLGALLTVDDLPIELRQRVLDRAEGNPLFVEEVVRMLIEEGVVERKGDRWLAKREAADVKVPDSVEALIRARLDTLPSPERSTVQAASVVGRIFQQSAVAAIAPATEHAALQQHLEDAILRDLITEERVPDEPTFRFRHILIRDVAYATLPKVRRADLHRGVADWLRAWAGERIEEFAEIEAYHLEQAVKLRRELEGAFDPQERDRAVAALRASAERVTARDDFRSARTFAERALALEPPPGDERMEIEALLADALWRTSEYRLGGEVATKLEVEAQAAGRMDLVGRALLVKAGDIWLRLESPDSAAGIAAVKQALEILTKANARRAMVRAYELMAWSGWWLGDMKVARDNWEEMRSIAHELGWVGAEAEALMGLGRVDNQFGDEDTRKSHIDEARALAARGASRPAKARINRMYGVFLATTGQDEEAEAVLLSSAAELEEFGDREEAYVALAFLGDIYRRRGELEPALQTYERARQLVLEHRGYLPEALRKKAQAHLLMGDVATAEAEAEEAVGIVAPDDWATVASTQMVLGAVRDAQGRDGEAETHLREALRVIKTTGFPGWEEEIALAEFLLRRGRTAEGEELLAQAMATARRFGPSSPLPAAIERRGAAAAAQGRA